MGPHHSPDPKRPSPDGQDNDGTPDHSFSYDSSFGDFNVGNVSRSPLNPQAASNSGNFNAIPPSTPDQSAFGNSHHAGSASLTSSQQLQEKAIPATTPTVTETISNPHSSYHHSSSMEYPNEKINPLLPYSSPTAAAIAAFPETDRSRASEELRHQNLLHVQYDEQQRFSEDGLHQTQDFGHRKARIPTGKIKRNLSISAKLHSTENSLRRISRRIPIVQQYVHKPDDDNAKEIEKERTVYFNQPLPEHEKDPATGNISVEYPRNKIRTTKYTPLNFLPKNIYHQFHNIANIYFLFIVILGAFSIFGVENPGLAAVPIIAIVAITAFKDAIEDYRRTVLDLEVNNTITHRLINIENPNIEDDVISPWRKFKKASTKASVQFIRAIVRGFNNVFRRKAMERKRQLERNVSKSSLELDTVATRNTVYSQISNSIYDASLHGNSLDLNRYGASSKKALEKDGTVIDRSRSCPGQAAFKRAYWKEINVGDIVKIYNNDEIPADVIILSTSDHDAACYIETRNLDGETNLKVRQGLNATKAIRHSRDLEQCVFQVDSEAPHLDLYSYSGLLKWKQRENPLDLASPIVERAEAITISNMLLRGCTIRNTKWVIGVVVYTGSDTRIMKNSGVTPTKRSRLTRELNINVIINFVFVFILSFVSGVVNGCSFRSKQSSRYFFEFGSIGNTAPVNGIITFWAAVILLQNLIPISLYITIEIVKTFQAFFIYSDCFMYYEPIDYPCTPKSWSISDDLGQIEYIFSDKTGTLTQNVMEFKKCTINGISYGKAFTEAMAGIMKREGTFTEQVAINKRQEIINDKEIMMAKLRGIYDSPEVFDNEVTFVSSKLVDDMEGQYGPEQSQAINHFLLVLALCHSVLPERTKDSAKKLLYKAQSPDESALVNFARDMGYALLERTRNGVIISEKGQEHEYEVLHSLEFNSARKRMSVIVRMRETGKIFLFCKGADNIIYSRLAPGVQGELRQVTADELGEFAREGLRTLCLAEKEIPEEEYQVWASRHELASQALQNREEQMEKVADEIERDLYLIGGTAIEDRLQEGVPETIELLSQAGIKLWVLTGDKVETAINIGYSCNLLDNGMELLLLQLGEKTVESANALLDSLLQTKFGLQYTPEVMKAAQKDHTVPSRQYAVVIDGDSLDIVVSPDVKERFVLLCKQCRSVLCCRVSPSQKALVVAAVKTTLDVTTLSIGDGANDVAMIQEADVGVGIAGLEGRQAVMSSDYGVGQFRFLGRLLLVHGRWAYRRLCEMVANMFYKNVVFTLTLFWYNFNNSFDGSYLFDYTYITLFNLAFTSLPVIFMGFLDQDVSDKISMAVPALYRRGILRLEWNQLKFWIYMIDGLYQSAVCYWLAFSMFYSGGFISPNGRQNNFREGYGALVATSAIVACNLYILINEYMWDWLFLLIVAISILLVFFWTGIYTLFTASRFFYKAAPQIYGSLAFWAYLLLASIACLLPRWAAKCYQKMYMPRDIDIVREQWRVLGMFKNLRHEGDTEDMWATHSETSTGDIGLPIGGIEGASDGTVVGGPNGGVGNGMMDEELGEVPIKKEHKHMHLPHRHRASESSSSYSGKVAV
ncbi:uncharacterized protein SAPINGB_P000975 [Magnusiomyces paraingens]|uniref:Phospholipid-transporting ATPase n=1 Tax=Magnusiomyces paraingens TaxID=2606893 RepID=A0A5E8B3A8_9ASCO|nr:uncharacterized protein SAPINGB_P000975 [Saprochaete ingens]VVT45956.1 unnamed protein product [Saprochaete ingens]